jgi:hypothetical protein
LRDVAWAYPPLDNWPEEQRVLSTLLERTKQISGPSSLDHAHLLVQMANRASQNRQFEEALAWMDQAIEVARGLPSAAIQLPGMIENRTQIEQAKDPKPARPFHTPFGAAGGVRRWFDADRFQTTDGETPVENLLHRPGRFEPPVEAPAPLPRPASPQR